MKDFLAGFDHRMEIVGVAESIVNRRNRNMELEKLFKDQELVNLVFSVLLFIMEKTLSEDSDCDKENIQRFISRLLPKYYDLHLTEEELSQLTDYILKSILQNDGMPYHFQTFDYETGKRKNIRIRLIADQVQEVNGGYKITYTLTDQGYDFLFRTKEVDQEIQITIEELKLKELIKRKNFKKAHDQSQNLIQMVRQKKKEIQLLMMKIKENIHDVDIDDYERLMNSTYDLLNEEYELLREIMDMARKSEEKLRQEYEENLRLDESLKKAQTEIRKINQNIKATLSEQRDLILSRQSLSKIYIETIGESFLYGMENRFDIEETILKPMEQHADRVEHFWKLVNPIFLPNPPKHLNIRSVYEPQGMIKLQDEKKPDFFEMEDLQQDDEDEKISRINMVYVEILEFIISYVWDKGEDAALEEMLAVLREQKELFLRFTDDRLFFTTILKLYDIGTIDIGAWRKRKGKVLMNLSEEFNLEYCLHHLYSKQEYMEKIDKLELVKKGDESIEVEISRDIRDGLTVLEKIEISNFVIKVEKSSE